MAAAEHVEEVRGHLAESIKDSVAQGSTAEEAQITALRNIGSDRLVADGILRAHSGIGEISTWRIGALPALIVCAYGVIPIYLAAGTQSPDWLGAFAMWLPTATLLTFIYACIRSRKLVLKPLVAAFAFILVINLAQICLTAPSSYGAHSPNVARFDHYINDLNQKIADAQTRVRTGDPMLASQGQSGYMAPSTYWVTDTAQGPFDPIEHEVHRRLTTQLVPIASAGQARDAWGRSGPAYVEQLKSDLAENAKFRSYWVNTKFTPSIVVTAAGRLLEMLGSVLAVLFLINAACLGLVWLAKAWFRRTWRPERLA